MGKPSLVCHAGAVALAIASAPANAQEEPFYKNGNTFLAQCEGNERVYGLACLSYVLGYYDGMPHSGIMCAPEDVTNKQLYDVVLKFIHDNPAQRHRSIGPLIIVAGMRAFPCGPTKSVK